MITDFHPFESMTCCLRDNDDADDDFWYCSLTGIDFVDRLSGSVGSTACINAVNAASGVDC